METIKLWLTRNNNAKNVPSDEVSLVLHEMVIKDIGIRGSDLFTITFSLVAKVTFRIFFKKTKEFLKAAYI